MSVEPDRASSVVEMSNRENMVKQHSVAAYQQTQGCVCECVYASSYGGVVVVREAVLGVGALDQVEVVGKGKELCVLFMHGAVLFAEARLENVELLLCMGIKRCVGRFAWASNLLARDGEDERGVCRDAWLGVLAVPNKRTVQTCGACTHTLYNQTSTQRSVPYSHIQAVDTVTALGEHS